MKKLGILLYITSYIQWSINVQWACYNPPEREYFFSNMNKEEYLNSVY